MTRRKSFLGELLENVYGTLRGPIWFFAAFFLLFAVVALAIMAEYLWPLYLVFIALFIIFGGLSALARKKAPRG